MDGRHSAVERINVNTLRVRRKSPFSGETRELDLPITSQQWDTYCRGAMVQEAFPHLNAAEREFIKTGISNEEWNAMLPDFP